MDNSRKWQAVAILTWVWPDGRQKIRARFYFSQQPTTERVIERIVSFQAGYPSPPNEIEVQPPTPRAKEVLDREQAELEAHELATAIGEAAIAAVEAEFRRERWAKLLDTWNDDKKVLMAPTAVSFAIMRAVRGALAPKAIAQTRRELHRAAELAHASA